MRKGKLAAQVAHASVNSVLINASGTLNKYIEEWLVDGMSKIVVSCNSEEELFQILSKAKEFNITTNLILDAGKTEFKDPTYTCVAIGPDEDYLIDQITGDLKLL